MINADTGAFHSMSHFWFGWILGLGLFFLPNSLFGQERFQLKETWTSGQTYQISVRADLKGNMLLAPTDKRDSKPTRLDLSGSSKIDYDERLLLVKDQQVAKVLRSYQNMEYKRVIGSQPQESQLRPQVRRIVLHRERGRTSLIFSPDHALTWHELDSIRMDLFFPALQGLLPTEAVAIGDRWPASSATLMELADLESLTEAKVECQFADVQDLAGRRVAVIHFRGALTGKNRDGENRQRLDGQLYFDLAANQIQYLSMNGASALVDQKGIDVGQWEGRFVITRKPSTTPDLSDERMRQLALEPTARNTALLFNEPESGMIFQYPRAWHIREADAKQIIVDFANEGGFVITRESLAQTPTIQQFQTEVQTALGKEKVAVLSHDRPQRLAPPPDAIDRFRYLVETNQKQKLLLEYFVLRQGGGGATVAARYPPLEAQSLTADMEILIRSVRIIEPKK